MKIKGFDKNSLIFFAVLMILYFGLNLYSNYKEQMISVVPETSSEELKSTSVNELGGDRISLTVPSTYVYGASQDNLNTAAQAAGYESITLNEDGSATYIITKEQHEKMLSDLRTGINDKLITLPGTDKFQDIDSITANDDFTEFTVKLTTTTSDFDSSMVSVELKMFSTMYNCFKGVIGETVHITYYNKSDVVVNEYTSKIE